MDKSTNAILDMAAGQLLAIYFRIPEHQYTKVLKAVLCYAKVPCPIRRCYASMAEIDLALVGALPPG